MTQPKIRVAVVGTGFGQAVHIPGFQRHHRTEVVSIYHHDLEKGKAITATHQIPHVSDRLEAILSRDDIDAVSIATPPFLHYEMAKQAITAGKHLLLEKPIALSASEARELYHLAKDRGVVVIADFEFRFVPAWQLLAEYLQQGYIGQPRLIKIDWLVASRANPQRPWNWYSRREMGGGALGAVGSHAFDYIHWLFGPVRRLSAQLSCAIAERPDPTAGGQLKPVDADDTCLISLELADGTPCQLTISSVAYSGRGHWLEVYGSKGTLVLGSSNLKDYVHGFQLQAAVAVEELAVVPIPPRLAFPQVFADGRLAPFLRVVERWVEAIDQGNGAGTGALPLLVPSLREGVYSQLLMDLALEASDRRTWVEVPDLDDFLEQ